MEKTNLPGEKKIFFFEITLFVYVFLIRIYYFQYRDNEIK